MQELASYVNGNCRVKIYDDGTKVREYEGKLNPEFPESIDLKITNYCESSCLYCHEMSDTNGKHAELTDIIDVLGKLPSGIELAIGGGNPMSYPDLVPLLISLRNMGFICNITVNQMHVKKNLDLLSRLIGQKFVYGVGVSVTRDDFDGIHQLMRMSDNVVCHMIAGVNDVDQVRRLANMDYCKVLLLGYKKYGRGAEFYDDKIEKNIWLWKMMLPALIGICALSFDNLALEQLDAKNIIPKDVWEAVYMGDDFTHSMYVDAVEKCYAPTSRSPDRVSFNDMSLEQFFHRPLEGK